MGSSSEGGCELGLTGGRHAGPPLVRLLLHLQLASCVGLWGNQMLPPRSGNGCSGRLRPGWLHPGGWHGRRNSLDLPHSYAAGERWYGWWRCRPGQDQSCQILDPLHPALNLVHKFFPLAARHCRPLPLCGAVSGVQGWDTVYKPFAKTKSLN